MMKDAMVLIDGLSEDNFRIKKGLAKAVLLEERGEKHYQWLETGSREYDVALEERIQKPFENGMLVVRNEDGTVKFDDRKLRYDGHYWRDGKCFIGVGPTHFAEFQKVDLEAYKDRDFFESIKKRGEEEYRNGFSYFSHVLAVDAIPVTSEGYVCMFKRDEGAEVFPGHWHIIGGMLDSDLTLFDNSNPSARMLSLMRKAIAKELKEEVNSEALDSRLVGLVDNIPGSANFSYIVNVGVGYNDFLDSMERAEDRADHSNVAVLRSKGEVEKFISKERITDSGYGDMLLYLKYG